MHKPALYMHYITATGGILRKKKKKKRLGQVFMQERKEPEDLVRSSSGVAIQGLLLLTYVGFWFSFLPLKTLKQSGMVPMRHELV